MKMAALSAQENGSTPGAAWSYCWTKLASDRELSEAVETLGRLQALPEDIRIHGEERARAFKPKLERPDLFTEADLTIPDTLQKKFGSTAGRRRKQSLIRLSRP